MNENTKLSVTDFKNWLSGVLDFQTDEWTPNLDQWKKILSKIKELEEVKSSDIPQGPTNVTPEQPTKTTAPRNPRPQVDKSVLPPDLNSATAQLPDTPVISGHKSVEVIQAQAPSIREEGNQRIKDTGKIYKTKENQSADYQSTFI